MAEYDPALLASAARELRAHRIDTEGHGGTAVGSYCPCSCGERNEDNVSGLRDHAHLRACRHVARAVLDAVAPLIAAQALREAAEWLANAIGFPVEVKMPDAPPPAALWDALVDVVHEDADGRWHGHELSREDVAAWLRDENGFTNCAMGATRAEQGAGGPECHRDHKRPATGESGEEA